MSKIADSSYPRPLSWYNTQIQGRQLCQKLQILQALVRYRVALRQITSLAPGTIVVVKDNVIKIKGIAWGGGGSGINRVDVSIDGGETFTRAELIEKPIKENRRSQWSWQFFEKELVLPDSAMKRLDDGESVQLNLTSNAFNASWNVQPSEPNYNAHGCCVKYRVPIVISSKIDEDIEAPEGDYANKPSGGRFKKRFVH